MKRQRPSESRNRILNVLYFVDANKTKSFKISLGAVYGFAATLAILLVWSFVSTLLLYQESQVADYRQERITHLLSTIFSYQQRYDAIYERSYPTAPKSVAGTLDKISKEAEAFGSAEPIKKALATKPSKTAKSLAKATASQSEQDKKTAQAEGADSAGAQKKEALAQLEKAQKEKPAQVDKPFAAVLEAIAATAKHRKSVEVGFSIRNNMKPQRAIGYVFAKATFVIDGKEVVKTAPAGPNFSQIDKPIRARGYKFSIRSFTRKKISLDYPRGDDVKLTQLELLVWSKTKREKVYPVAMSKIRMVQELVKSKPAPKPSNLLPTKDPFPAAPATKGPLGKAATEQAKHADAVSEFSAEDPFPSPKLKGVEEDPVKPLPPQAPSEDVKNAAGAKELAKDVSPGS